MKMGMAHTVPLSDWALETLAELRQLSDHDSPYFATNNLNRPLNCVVLSKAMQRMGYGDRAVPHGFRAMGSSILNESGQLMAMFSNLFITASNRHGASF